MLQNFNIALLDLSTNIQVQFNMATPDHPYLQYVDVSRSYISEDGILELYIKMEEVPSSVKVGMKEIFAYLRHYILFLTYLDSRAIDLLTRLLDQLYQTLDQLTRAYNSVVNYI